MRKTAMHRADNRIDTGGDTVTGALVRYRPTRVHGGKHGSSLGFLAGLGLTLGVAFVEASQSKVIAKAWACVAAFFPEQKTQRRLRHPGLLRNFLLSEPEAVKAGFKIVPVHALHIAMPISLWQ